MKLELSEFLRPSRAKTWASCLASPGFCFTNQDRLIPFSNTDQEEGTRVHAYAAAVLNGNAPEPDMPEELWQAAMGFVNYVQSVKAKFTGASLMYVERTIQRHYAPGACTPDIVLWDVAARTLHIIDLKVGIGVEVEAEKNLQLLLYGYAAIRAYAFAPKKVELHIYMPRHHTGEQVSTWTVLDGSDPDSMYDPLSAAESILAHPHDQPFTPSDEACQFCPAQSFCTARAKQATEAIQVAELRAIDLGAFEQLSEAKLAAMYQAIPKAKKFFNKLEEYVEARATAGVKFPGLKMVAGRAGNRKWMDEKKAYTLLRKLFPEQECRHISTISPTEVDKLAKAFPCDPEQYTALENLIVRPEGAPSLVPESDKRPALTETISAAFEELPKSTAE